MNPLLNHILTAVEVSFGVSREEITSKARPTHIADARMAYYLLALQETRLASHIISEPVNKERSSVSYGKKNFIKHAEAVPSLKSQIEQARKMFREAIK
jgi:chromosomal replication initiation ATPase DnaA